MWPFRRHTTLTASGILQGFTDRHCHLLPGVDDGVKTLEKALQILAFNEQLGIREVWLTPHIMEDIPNTTEGLRETFKELQAAYSGHITLHLASENMLDNLFEERLETDDLLPLGEDGRSLLVETSYFNPPMGLDDTLQRIKTKGYFPVLAHPERYMYMEKADYQRLKALGVKFQLNLPSVAGAYGPEVRAKAEWLLQNGLYDMAGSDAHGLGAWQMAVARKISKAASVGIEHVCEKEKS